MNLFYEFDKASVYDIHEVNSSFASGSLKVLYLGDNRNGSHFTKDAVERALPSLLNVPIVCHWDYESGEIGGHDIEVVSTDDGGLRLRNLTEPCGVVPEHATFRFSVEADDNGDEHEYLIVDNVLLWKRQDVYNHIVGDLNGKVNHSMEIKVLDGRKNQDGYYDIRNFEFTALCLLESVDPCFQGSELEVYSAANFKQKMEQMMTELKEYFSLNNSPSEDTNNQTNESLMEGGEITLDNNIETNENFVNEPVEQPEEVADNATETIVADDAQAPEENEFALNSNIVEELSRIVREIEVESTPWGPESRYFYRDCDTELNEVYCIDITDWTLWGFSYGVDGDVITIDPASKKRKKYIIVDFDGEEIESPLVGMFARIRAKFDEFATLESECGAANARVAEMESELADLRAYKNNNETEKANAERLEVLDRFEDLNGIAEYDELRENFSNYDISELEEKCFAIRGKNIATIKFNLDYTAPKLAVDKHITDSEPDPYGGIVAKFANQK